MPKYFVRAASVTKTAATTSLRKSSRASPSNQNTVAQTQKASIITSHMIVVLEIRKTGENKVANAASIGRLQKMTGKPGMFRG